MALVPDIGASYFFSKPIGNFGARLDGAELLICVLAPHFVPSSKLSLLEELLCKVESNDPTYVYALIDKYSQQPVLKENSVYHKLVVIIKFLLEEEKCLVCEYGIVCHVMQVR